MSGTSETDDYMFIGYDLGDSRPEIVEAYHITPRGLLQCMICADAWRGTSSCPCKAARRVRMARKKRRGWA